MYCIFTPVVYKSHAVEAGDKEPDIDARNIVAPPNRCMFLLAILPAVGVSFGKLFDDEEGQQFFEAIVGTLRAAKKRGVVDFKGQVWMDSV